MNETPVPGVLSLLLRANGLKTLPRTGWALRGVAAPESVAAHAHGTALVALALLELVDEPLDRARALAMAVLHDLPECVTGDWPVAAGRLLPPGAKAAAESAALASLLAGQPFAGVWRDLWREYDERRTPEARLVRDADRLDLLLQALVYERTTGHRDLGEFWEGTAGEPFAFPASAALAEALGTLRQDTELK